MVSNRWGLEHRSRNRYGGVDLVRVVVDMRNSGRIHTVEFQRFHWKWR